MKLKSFNINFGSIGLIDPYSIKKYYHVSHIYKLNEFLNK